MTRLALIADDLTGALDSAAPFALRGYWTTLALTGLDTPDGTEIEVHSTESRNLPDEPAADQIRQLAATSRIREADLIYKKIDSTLRGPIAAELGSLLGELGIERALVCPAFPQQGRTMVAGGVLVNGEPLLETVFAGEVESDSLIELLINGGLRDRLSHLPLNVLREEPDETLHTLSRPGLVIADAETTEDLRLLARNGPASGIRLLVGSAGLAYALADEFPTRSEIRRQPSGARGGHVLVVAGSQHPRTLEQVAALRGSDLPDSILVAPPLDRQNPRRPETVAVELANAAHRFVQDRNPEGLVVTGGDIARAVCSRLGATHLHLIGQIEPGLPLSRIVGGVADGTWLVTKAGGFGDERALVRAVRYLAT